MTQLQTKFVGSETVAADRLGACVIPLVRRFSLYALLLGVAACGSNENLPAFGAGSGGNGTGPRGSGGAGIVLPPRGGSFGLGGGSGVGGADCSPRAIGLVRDFKADHPDFEEQVVTEEGIVAINLGADKKPVFAAMGLRSVTNAANFNQWYRDTPDVNRTYEHTIVFTTNANGRGVYDNSVFFPLDDRGFGNEGRNHNFHFTFELHMEFKYNGGEVFTFRGDDDLWVFVNNKLGIDLGGVHAALERTLDLDAKATQLGLVPGNVYPLDFFQAERHTSESNFRIETNLEFTNCEPIIVR